MDGSFQCPRYITRKPIHSKLLKHLQIDHENEQGFPVTCESCPRPSQSWTKPHKEQTQTEAVICDLETNSDAFAGETSASCENDRSAKSVLIPDELAADGTIPGKAVEKWTLFRTLPVLVGNKIREDNTLWLLYLQLRDVGEIILAPTVSIHSICHLHALISLFLIYFKNLFPG